MGQHVLVVDDDPTVSDVVRRYLELAGFEVTLAADGLSALAAAQARRPDLVVLDLMLPGIDGLEVCRRLAPRRCRRCRSSCSPPSARSPTAWSASHSAPTTTSPSRSRPGSSSCGSSRCCGARRGHRPRRPAEVLRDGDLEVDVARAGRPPGRGGAGPDRARVRPAGLPAPQPGPGVPAGRAARGRVGLDVRRPVHRDRPCATVAGEDRARPGRTRARIQTVWGVGYRYEPRGRRPVRDFGLIVLDRHLGRRARGRAAGRGSLLRLLRRRSITVHVLRAARRRRAGRAGRHRRGGAGHVHRGARPVGAAGRGRCGRRGQPAVAFWLGAGSPPTRCGRPRSGTGSGGWRPAAGSWSPGCRTTCARRWPGCARWPRRWRTGSWPTRQTVAEYHRRIRIETDRMAGLVDDLFELSRINAGALRLSLASVALGDLVSDAVACGRAGRRRPRRAAGGRRARLAHRAGQRARAARVLANLLRQRDPAHAVGRHGHDQRRPRRRRRVVRGRRRAAAASRRPTCPGSSTSRSGRRPHGPGRPLSRGAPLAGDGGAGGGLGLAIVRGLVEAHHGTVGVANTGPGCRFVVRLP